jgi:hypothetical protein
MLQAGRSRVRVPMRWIFQFTLSFQQHYDPGVDSTSNRNEYQESSWGGGIGRPALRLTTSPRFVSLDVSEPYGPSQPITEIALVLLFWGILLSWNVLFSIKVVVHIFTTILQRGKDELNTISSSPGARDLFRAPRRALGPTQPPPSRWMKPTTHLVYWQN